MFIYVEWMNELLGQEEAETFPQNKIHGLQSLRGIDSSSQERRLLLWRALWGRKIVRGCRHTPGNKINLINC